MNTRLVNALLLILFLAASPVFAQKYPPISEGQRIKMLTPPTNRPVRMVLDTDTFNEIDDQFALAYLLRSEDVARPEAIYAALVLAAFGQFLQWLRDDSVGPVIGAGAALGAGFLMIVRWSYYLVRKTEGMGLGDVKLLAMIGAVVGPAGVLDTILASSLVGLLLGGAQALARGALGRPFGFAPAIAVGTVAILFLPPLWLLRFF
mgnify:CR=1 FL=1